MDNDAAAPNRLSDIVVVSVADLVVVDHLIRLRVPDLDAVPQCVTLLVNMK